MNKQRNLGVKMKKFLLVAVAALLTAGLTPAKANEGAIAIIDVNFESQMIDGPVTEVCITSELACKTHVLPRRAADFKIFNHGTIMADIVRANNPAAPLFLLESGTTKTGVVTGVQLAAALNWVVANAAANNIRAVSFSYNSGNGSRCTPASPGVRIETTHNSIVAVVASLKMMGVKVYAASGNYASGNNIDYPACIPDVIAVGSTTFRGSIQKSDLVITTPVYKSPKLKSTRTALQGLFDSFPITLDGPNPVMVGDTTSVTTAIAAATNR
jgi:hypothetical protein